MRTSDSLRGSIAPRAASSRRAGTGVVLVTTALATSAMLPVPAHGQTRVVLAGHVGSSAAAPGGVMVDIAGELQQGLLGVRAGVAMDAAGTALAPMVSGGGGSSGVWAADMDVGFNLGRIPYADVVFGRTDPSVFLGAGMAGVSSLDAVDGERSSSLVPTWTYGARAGLPIASWLGFELEARHRQTFGTVAPEVYPVRDGWEYRAGLALRFGGGGTSRPPTAAPRRGDTVGERTGDRSAGARDARRSASAEEVADRTLSSADRYIGTPYRWGGTSPSTGFDCSGFVQYVFAEQGIALPRVSRDQARAGRALPTSLTGLARGDLLFFAQGGSTVDHVAIYAGDGRIVHSSSSGSGVRYDELTGNRGRWYVQHLAAVRRVIADDVILDRDPQLAEEPLPRPRRELPLDEAFEAITGERGDEAAPPGL